MDAVSKLALAVLLLLSTAACSAGADCPTPVPGSGPGPIPDCILERSDQIVIARLGRAFFRERVVYQPALSSYSEGEPACIQDPANCVEFASKPHYRMAYSFTVPDLPGQELPIAFIVDTVGKLAPGAVMDGLPDCAHDPGECVFKVADETAAMAIARQAGLEPGLDPWGTHFHWYGGEFQTYVWTVENKLAADKSTGQSSGRTLVIDANSGEVLQVFDLQVMP